MANQSLNKKKIRKDLFQLRKKIPSYQKIKASKKACATLLQMSVAHNLVLSFASFSSEINLWPLNKELIKQKKLVLPRVEKSQLALYRVFSYKDLILSLFGMLEPDPNQSILIPPEEISLSLIPGLGFDKKNHRIGFGGGYYDRLLQKGLKQTLGIGYKEQCIPEALPTENHDIALDALFLF